MLSKSIQGIREILKTYRELISIPSFEERYEYLRLDGRVAEETFGYARWLNQDFYHSYEWRNFRNKVIVRDQGCDLACPGYFIPNHIIIHHLNPLTPEDIENMASAVFDLENVVCCSKRTHDAIHYGNAEGIARDPVERFAGDTVLW